jgi:hypothetical protein
VVLRLKFFKKFDHSPLLNPATTERRIGATPCAERTHRHVGSYTNSFIERTSCTNDTVRLQSPQSDSELFVVLVASAAATSIEIDLLDVYRHLPDRVRAPGSFFNRTIVASATWFEYLGSSLDSKEIIHETKDGPSGGASQSTVGSCPHSWRISFTAELDVRNGAFRVPGGLLSSVAEV